MDTIFNIILFTALAVCVLGNDGSGDFCLGETFNAKCSYGELIMVTEAKYGFMGESRCARFDNGVDCVLDSMDILKRECEWKNQCIYPVAQMELEISDDCLKDVRPYLLAKYTCIAVEMQSKCTSTSPVKVSHTEGSISSAITRQTGCGSMTSPWRFELLKGQSVSFKLKILPGVHNNSSLKECVKLGYVYNHANKENTTICEQLSDGQIFFTGQGNIIDLQLRTDDDAVQDFIIEYKISGCIDLVTPELAWYNRAGDEAVIGCLYRNISWHLHCVDSNWQGVVGRCPDIVKPTLTPKDDENEEKDYKFLILICVTAVIFILLIMCSVIGIVKYLDHKKCQSHKQLAIPMDATCHRYSGEPQRPLMYTDVVPDLLESSLPRSRHMAESECSSQTYYPGTMYFMGLQGQNQQDVQLPLPKSQRHQEVPIPLPPTSKSDSESESEHVYDKIPCEQ